MNAGLDLVQRYAGLEARGYLRAWLSIKSVPALGLAARLAVLVRHVVIGMHLDAEFFAGKDYLDQQG